MKIILIVLIFAFWCVGVFFYIKEDDFDILLVASILLLLFLHLFFEDIYCEINPPKTVEENGYIYQLEDYQPEQTIERYGETYVLVTE
ncbi:MAG: hypothetical protein IJY83_01020 [Oscillospiraceae bacterium]|nr:hypothetical protein [Oscillospiraceae bacterium]